MNSNKEHYIILYKEFQTFEDKLSGWRCMNHKVWFWVTAVSYARPKKQGNTKSVWLFLVSYCSLLTCAFFFFTFHMTNNSKKSKVTLGVHSHTNIQTDWKTAKWSLYDSSLYLTHRIATTTCPTLKYSFVVSGLFDAFSFSLVTGGTVVTVGLLSPP